MKLGFNCILTLASYSKMT